MNRIYISGPMSGVKNFRQIFEYWEERFEGDGAAVVNPDKIFHEDVNNRLLTLEEDLKELGCCNMIFFMKGWEKAGGCLAEWGYAKRAEMPMLFEGPNHTILFENREIPDGLDVDISELELSVRSYNCLKRAGTKTVSDLVEALKENPEYLYGIRNLGKSSAYEIAGQLDKFFRENDIPKEIEWFNPKKVLILEHPILRRR